MMLVLKTSWWHCRKYSSKKHNFYGPHLEQVQVQLVMHILLLHTHIPFLQRNANTTTHTRERCHRWEYKNGKVIRTVGIWKKENNNFFLVFMFNYFYGNNNTAPNTHTTFYYYNLYCKKKFGFKYKNILVFPCFY